MSNNVETSAYKGTWQLNNRTVVKYTPDALVFLNGDTSLPGCARCRGRVEIQRYVTSISVEAGTEPGSHSGSVTLSLPKVQGQQLFIDGYNVLRPGLEIHIFMRGYFPVRGMFKHLSDPQAGRELNFANPTSNDRLDLSKYASYPYYPVFHGVVTQVSYEYSDGVYNGSLQCASLLHFWQYQNFAGSAAWLADNKPTNDPGRPTLYGHNFNNVTPFGIIYTLYRDVAGAAGGVEFALSEASNLDAAVSDGDRQLFDQVALYWEQRFKTRIQSLRMYGVNGQLFNAAQQAWIGGASTRDVNQLLPSPTYNDGASTRTEHDPLSSRLSVAKSLGLGNAGLDFVYSPLIKEDNELVSMSILDMYAFTQSISDIGTVNQWQTTYETKLDIAQRVCEVTGYEFYQDVDGDLVFKPPFYNMDTSTNRYFRLEDQDIINITFTEKEPQATYIIVRGNWFPGVTGVVGTDGPLNLRGMYVDWKLVAKFGWRPAATLEITYQSDPKVLFWIGVARLDLLNVDTFSANCTIPIRPELRPGYPVYIPFCDCYYYISQISHQFAFGGQCTTSLVLTCRRAKWHAPGFLEPAPEGQSAINLIRLDRPDLPPRPLEIFNNGIPRIVGFPNVVMALDPRKFDPGFSVVGAGIDYFLSTEAPADLLIEMLDRDIEQLAAFEVIQNSESALGKRYALRYGKDPGDIVEFGLEDLRTAFTDFQSSQATLGSIRSDLRQAQTEEANARAGENAFDLVQKTGGQSSTAAGDRVAALANIDNLDAQLFEEQTKEFSNLRSNGSRQLLDRIFTALQPSGNNAKRRKVGGIPLSDVNESWFEGLSHLKSQYMADSVPGQYRYFSCSHPDESQQGMPIIEWDDGARGKTIPTTEQKIARTFGRTISSTFKLTNNLFTSAGGAIATLPGIASWLDPNALANASTSDSEVRRLLGLTGKRRDAAQEKMDETIAQRIVNIMTAVNEIVGTILANRDYQAAVRETNGYVLASPRLLSGFRPDAEPTSSEAFHSAGVAIDVTFANGSSQIAQASGFGPAYLAGMDVVRKTVSEAFSQGLVKGIGFYDLNPNRGGTFVHMDRRGDLGSIDEINEKYRQQGKLAPGKSVPRTGAWTEGGDVDAFGRPLGWKAWAEATNSVFKLGASLARIGSPKLTAGATESTEPLPAPPPTPLPETVVEDGYRPIIQTRELNAEVERYVVQFQPTVTVPDGALRSPEAELGVGKCKKGLQIALGPQRTPQILTTDQIQTISFVRHGASKFTQVVGTSGTSGSVSYNALGTQKEIYNKFTLAAQDVSDPDTIVKDIYEPPYNQMAEDLRSVPIPTYTDGIQTGETTIDLIPFPSVLRTEPSSIPAAVRGQFPDVEEISISDLTISQTSLLPGYRPQGKQQDDGKSWQRAVNALASDYANSVTKQIENTLTSLLAASQEPATDRDARIASIQNAINEATTKAFGVAEASGTLQKNTEETKAVKEGKIEKPIHSPVFPISDEKGYEHYGAYRYGRGLSVDPGGTFEFIHNGQDPFQNVTAQTAEEFLRVFTLAKSGKISNESSFLQGVWSGAVGLVESVLNERKDPFAEGPQVGGTATVSSDTTAVESLQVGELGLSDQDRNEIEQSVKDLATTVTQLGRTVDGQQALRELLEANGDDPNLILQDSFQITDTQFARNYVNFAVNYGKSPVFKTTAANAAYKLADLTAHLLANTGEACICRGSLSDVLMEAYARRTFVAVEDIDQVDEKAEAFQSEQIILSMGQQEVQESQVSGAIIEGAPPDAKTNPQGTNPSIQSGNSSAILSSKLGDGTVNRGFRPVQDTEEGG